MPRSENERDQASILDMLAAARECLSYVDRINFTMFSEDRMRFRAVERTLEVIGEAARRLTPEKRAAHPDVPWARITGQRNFISHGYDHVASDRLWLVATTELPRLIAQLEAIGEEVPKSA